MTARPLDATGQSLRMLVLLRRYENTLAAQSAAILAKARDALVQILERQDLTVVSAGRVPRRQHDERGGVERDQVPQPQPARRGRQQGHKRAQGGDAARCLGR